MPRSLIYRINMALSFGLTHLQESSRSTLIRPCFLHRKIGVGYIVRDEKGTMLGGFSKPLQAIILL